MADKDLNYAEVPGPVEPVLPFGEANQNAPTSMALRSKPRFQRLKKTKHRRRPQIGHNDPHGRKWCFRALNHSNEFLVLKDLKKRKERCERVCFSVFSCRCLFHIGVLLANTNTIEE